MNEHVHGCTGKRKYATRELALERSGAVRERRLAKEQFAYQCPHCGCWHTSSQTPREAKRRWRIEQWRRRNGLARI